MRSAVVLGLAAVSLAACGKGGGLAGRNAPDEFAISRNAPLVVPPDFALTPPKPGEARPIGQDAQGAAAEALFGPGVRVPPKSAVEQNLLDKAGATKPEAGIRSSAGDPQTPTVDKGAFLKELMGAPAGTTNAQVAEVVPG